jgi:hypothetical protein
MKEIRMQVEEVETEPVELEEETATNELPAHVARCAQCSAGVKYRMTTSGTGLLVLERYGMDLETSVGLGESALPVCPFGARGDRHGLPRQASRNRTALPTAPCEEEASKEGEEVTGVYQE